MVQSQWGQVSRGGRLNKQQAMDTLKGKGYDDAAIADILSKTASPFYNRNGARMADLYSVASYPNYKAPEPKAPVTTPTTPTTPTKPTTPTETPHQKAIRLAREAASKYYNTAYGDLSLGAGDAYGVNKRFNELLNTALTKIPATENKIDINFADLFNTAKTERTTAEQNKIEQAVNAITPTGYENTYFADTSDDAILNEILTGQKNDVVANFKRQLERGQISQGAYDYAMNSLNQGTAGAQTTLNNIGSGVLSGYRTDIGDLVENFNKGVAGYELGDKIDPNVLKKQITDYVGGTNLKGDIISKFGNTQLFDPNTLIAKAGSVVGPSNQPLAGGNPQGTGSIQDENNKRTVGTSGVF